MYDQNLLIYEPVSTSTFDTFCLLQNARMSTGSDLWLFYSTCNMCSTGPDSLEEYRALQIKLRSSLRSAVAFNWCQKSCWGTHEALERAMLLLLPEGMSLLALAREATPRCRQASKENLVWLGYQAE